MKKITTITSSVQNEREPLTHTYYTFNDHSLIKLNCTVYEWEYIHYLSTLFASQVRIQTPIDISPPFTTHIQSSQVFNTHTHTITQWRCLMVRSLKTRFTIIQSELYCICKQSSSKSTKSVWLWYNYCVFQLRFRM